MTVYLSSESFVYGDSAYLDYALEDIAFERLAVMLKIQRKPNSKTIDTTEQKLEKLKMRKRIEVAINDIKKFFQITIHVVTIEGLLIKLTLFIFGLQMKKMFN